MGDALLIRTASVSDAPVIARHRAGMFRDMGQLPPALYAELLDVTIAYLSRAIPSGEYVGWLASEHETADVVAGAGVQLRRILPRPIATDGTYRIALAREAIVLNVFTETAWRRKGIARQLMNHVLEWAAGAQIDRLVLHASEEGRPLYERLGFVLTNEMRYAKPLR